MSVTAERTNTARHTGRWGLWVLQVVTALGFVGAAMEKFEGSAEVMRTFDALGWSAWPRILLAILELVGAVALLVPRLTGAAATGFVTLTTCAVCVQVAVGESVVPAAVMLVLSGVVAWCRRATVVRIWRMIRFTRQER